MKNQNLVNFFVKDSDNVKDKIKQLSQNSPLLVIFDDLMHSDNLDVIAEIYTMVGRHNKISAIFLSQKLFLDNKFYRQISQNADYLILFKNPRNSNEIRSLEGKFTVVKHLC